MTSSSTVMSRQMAAAIVSMRTAEPSPPTIYAPRMRRDPRSAVILTWMSETPGK